MPDSRTGEPRLGRLRQALTNARRIFGMPDYDAYLEHLRRHHPGAPFPTRRVFYEQYLASRYGDAPTRCC
jgi:uncharacterized short protein YbdD (DUF466 family)